MRALPYLANRPRALRARGGRRARAGDPGRRRHPRPRRRHRRRAPRRRRRQRDPPRRRAERPGGRARRARAAPRDLPPAGREGRRARAATPRWTASTEAVEEAVGEPVLDDLLDAVADEFPDVDDRPAPVRLEELLLVRVANENPAARPLRDLVDDAPLPAEPTDGDDDGARGVPGGLTPIGPNGETLVELLRAPARAHPTSLAGQLRYVRDQWRGLLGARPRRAAGPASSSRSTSSPRRSAGSTCGSAAAATAAPAAAASRPTCPGSRPSRSGSPATPRGCRGWC